MPGLLLQVVGLSGSGKTTLSNSVAKKLAEKNIPHQIIDGDIFREKLCSDLGFSKEDRNENIRRLGFVGKLLAEIGGVVLLAAINPYAEIRKELSEMGPFVKTVYVKCPINVLQKRDVKGLYERALLPDGHQDKIYSFTGISDPFECPKKPDLIIETNKETLEESTQKLYNFIIENI